MEPRVVVVVPVGPTTPPPFIDDDLPMGVNHVGLPAPPAELVGAGKCVVHSTKSVGDTHEEVVRAEFRRLRGGPSTDLLAPDDLGERGAEIGSDFPMA